MKKGLSIAMLLLLLLASCSSAADDGQPGSIPVQAVVKEETAEEDSLELLTNVLGVESSTTSPTGFYESYTFTNGKANILYTDYESKTRVFLCNRPDCTHDNESCTSFLGENIVGANLFMSSDDTQLYVVTNSNPDKEIPSRIWRMDADGDNRQLLYSLGADELLFDAVVGNSRSLYFMTQSLSSGLQPIKTLFHLDIQTGEATELKQIDGINWLSGTDGQNLYILYSSGMYGDTKYEYRFCVYAPSTGEESTVFQYAFDMDSENNSIVNMMVYDDSLLLIKYNGDETGSLVKYDIKTQEETLLCENIPVFDTIRTYVYSPVDGYLFIDSARVLEPGKVEMVSNAVNLSTGMLRPITMYYGEEYFRTCVKTIGVYGDSYFVQSGVEMRATSLIGNDGVPYETQIEVPVYGMISKEDFWSNTPNYLPIQDTVVG